VTDIEGDWIVGARVTVENSATKVTKTAVTDDEGQFRFEGLEAGRFALNVSSDGFALFTSSSIELTDEDYDLPVIALPIATTMTEVDVRYTTWDRAQEEIKAAEKQRIFAVFPNFYVVYDRNPAPLSAGQKYKLALRASSDPGFFLQSALVAAVEQGLDSYHGYGQGAQGYFKRYGASTADGFTSQMIGGAILPSILHQDPRYFYKGTGSITSRALYAISTVVICKGDNGKWQPNYSNIFGNLASAGISNLYYPASDRHGAGTTISNALIGSAGGAFSSLMQEFVLRRISHGLPPTGSK
jgi:hypothetical protein